MFGRGDEDGFPALPPTIPQLRTQANITATRPNGARGYSPAALRNLHFEHSAVTKSTHGADTDNRSALRVENGHPSRKSSHHRSRDPSPVWGHSNAMQHSIEEDISMTMRRRVIRGYGLMNVSLRQSVLFFPIFTHCIGGSQCHHCK